MDIALTKKELATIAGYTYRRLYDIDRELPEGKKLFVPIENDSNKFDLRLFVQHWVEYNVGIESDGIDLNVIKAKHEVVKTEKTQIEVDKLRGQLIDINDVKRLWGTVANTVMQNLIHLPSKIAPMVLMMDNVEIISDIIGTEIRKVLEAMADTPIPDEDTEQNNSETEDEDQGV